MNWQFLVWVAGVMATWTALKFIFVVFKRLGSRNSIGEVLDRAEDGLQDAADKVAGAWKNRKKVKRNEERPMVTIR